MFSLAKCAGLGWKQMFETVSCYIALANLESFVWPGWPWVYRGPPDSTSQVLGVKVWSPPPSVTSSISQSDSTWVYLCSIWISRAILLFSRVLILHLKRYSFNVALSLNNKIGQQVIIPRYLTLSSHCTENTKPPFTLGWSAHMAM